MEVTGGAPVVFSRGIGALTKVSQSQITSLIFCASDPSDVASAFVECRNSAFKMIFVRLTSLFVEIKSLKLFKL